MREGEGENWRIIKRVDEVQEKDGGKSGGKRRDNISPLFHADIALRGSKSFNISPLRQANIALRGSKSFSFLYTAQQKIIAYKKLFSSC